MHVIHGGRSHQTNDHPFKIPAQLRLQVINQILEDRKRRKEKKTQRRGRTCSIRFFMLQLSLDEQLLWSEQDQKDLAKESLCSVPVMLLWRLGCSSHFTWVVQPKKAHRHWSLKSTYPANSAFIGDQNLLTLGNVQFGQALNDGIFICAWRNQWKPVKLLVPEPEACSGLAQGVPLATQPYTHPCTTWVSSVHECLSPAAPHHGTEKTRAWLKTFLWARLGFPVGSSCPVPSKGRQWGEANGWTSPPKNHQ